MDCKSGVGRSRAGGSGCEAVARPFTMLCTRCASGHACYHTNRLVRALCYGGVQLHKGALHTEGADSEAFAHAWTRVCCARAASMLNLSDPR